MPEPILLTHKRAPGDIVCFTAVARDLELNYPGKYEIHVFTSCLSLWEGNPYVKPHNAPVPGIPRHDLTYGHHINQANKLPLHFLTSFHRSLQEKSAIDVPVLYPKGDLHLDDWHKQNRPTDSRYWYMLSGGKSDFTTKVWSATRHQQTVNQLRQHGLQFVQDGATHSGHWHPPLEGVLNTIGTTNLRDMMWLIYHADGVICPITAAMHMAAAFDKPCVVVAGGREHWWWEAYVNTAADNFGPIASRRVKVPHRYLHTQGLLDCCAARGCWKNKVSEREPDKHKSYCKKPADDDYGQIIPECLKMIRVETVVKAVLSYYANGILPPISQPYAGQDHEHRLETDPLFCL